ncbi:MAG: tRNA-dihydrouridine synthase family protein [Simkaniaceae bacterium]|nr:tRNA-dihydrouridine synthase family protein [Simkaniaceae bacterium]
MEGVASAHFRQALSQIGGFDEACTEFLRVPTNPHIESLVKQYSPHDTAPIPQAAQIMGSHPEHMSKMTLELIRRGAPRVDLNCGCPSNIVTGRGAGSSLLKDPNLLYDIAKAMVDVSTVPISIKLRSGFDDTSLFEENLLAAQASGAAFITLHPRTKKEGYIPPANWSLIRRAKELLSIPVIGNGDILSVNDALRMIEQTGCDALMIGRGALRNPWIFHQIKWYFDSKEAQSTNSLNSTSNKIGRESGLTTQYILSYLELMPKEMNERGKINQLKQLFRYLFESNDELLSQKKEMLTTPYHSANEFIDKNLCKIEKFYN